jgi:chromosomal replication initiation ATPase DnaA
MAERVAREDGKMTLAKLLYLTALDHGVSTDDLRSQTRCKEVVEARREFFYRARSETGYSSPAIGRACNKDHSSVLKGASAYSRYVSSDYR